MAGDDDQQQGGGGGGGGGPEEAGEEEAKAAAWGEDNEKAASASSSDESEDESEYSSDDYEAGGYESSEAEEDDNSAESNVRKFAEALESRANRKRAEEEERDYVYHEDLFDFPRDPEKWREEDLRELWADAPLEMTKPGWDPAWADDDDWEVVRQELAAGRDPPIAPFYLPYRKYYPAIPDNHYDISNPRSVVEELDRIEEFLKWVSYVFPDGSTYEGTVWDDLAHGKGVYVAEDGLVRYEGEWLQNQMEGHGVIEVDIPGVEPAPGSELEAKMRAEGRIISRDFMSPEDKRWLEMDMEDSLLLAGNKVEIPFYERDEWIKVFGEKPEKGRYRYAGQWKHGRMHGCGVYEVNERAIYGRFYFGEHLEDSTGCDEDVSALHFGIAEVAAAKARMFVNKPDGMVREERGPYGDPQHPYFYEEDDVWMAPGFINQFYEVPDYWKTYVQEVDQERELWLGSFYKAPLRIPMPAELEYWWSKGDDDPEFVLINKEPEPDPEDPSKLIYTEDPLIFHTRTGRLINYVDDEKYGVRLFWQPRLKEGEDVDPEKVEFLPLEYDEFFGKTSGAKKESKLSRLITKVENALKPLFEKFEKWAEEKKKASEMNLKLIEKELDFIEAEICLEETLEDMENELKMKQEEEEKRAAAGKDKDESSPAAADQDAAASDDGDDEEDEDGDESAPASFGTVRQGRADEDTSTNSLGESKPGNSPFSSLTLSVASGNLISLVPAKLQESYLFWRKHAHPSITEQSSLRKHDRDTPRSIHSVNFPLTFNYGTNLRARQQLQHCEESKRRYSQKSSLARSLSSCRTCKKSQADQLNDNAIGAQNFSILSLHVPVSDVFTI
ncbi:protein TIC 100 [Ananas comosus]|uniref:Protein TIC 100 n=1 Tax=Ananas comosus TaxID=4615 RepID=A0A6P5GPJ1_ANACO|nr:protein TIC 100 [Ananas comosus]XP_020107341.1 protein TIC 100 [Ananas comosus]